MRNKLKKDRFFYSLKTMPMPVNGGGRVEEIFNAHFAQQRRKLLRIELKNHSGGNFLSGGMSKITGIFL